MPIEFDCPECGEHLSLWDELAGKQGACPKCKASLTVPGAEVTMACPKCEGEIPASAIICTHCGVNLKSGQRLETRVNEPSAVQKVAEETAGAILGLLWRHRVVLAIVVAFFAGMIALFSALSKKTIEPGAGVLQEDRGGATQR